MIINKTVLENIITKAPVDHIEIELEPTSDRSYDAVGAWGLFINLYADKTAVASRCLGLDEDGSPIEEDLWVGNIENTNHMVCFLRKYTNGTLDNMRVYITDFRPPWMRK